MSVKELKPAFHGPALQAQNDAEAELPENEPDECGCYPRSVHIIDFVLTNLFETGYLIPHIDKIRFEDSADIMTEEELEAIEGISEEELGGKKIERLASFHDPEHDYCFEFDGLDDWAPFQARLVAVDHDDEAIDKEDAHESVQAAINEFMYDLSMATTNVQHIRVNAEEGTIQSTEPLALFRAIRDLITWRNDEAELAEKTVKLPTHDPKFPMEFRPIYLPQYGLERPNRARDADTDRIKKTVDGMAFFHEEDDVAEEDKLGLLLQNLPPMAYNSRTDLYLAAHEMRERLEFRSTMVRLDEMEAIIMQETRREKSYAPNPLLNLH